jgi:hypothetical protein
LNIDSSHQCIQEQRLRELETGQTETRVYMKLVREDMAEIKAQIKDWSRNLNTIPAEKDSSPVKSSEWQPVMIELIKLTGLAITVAGVVYGALKWMGK